MWTAVVALATAPFFKIMFVLIVMLTAGHYTLNWLAKR
jgi:hypothetical protein